jgi:hypothetical protein
MAPQTTPLANSYWVRPGRLLAGEHPFGESPTDAHDRLAALREAGIDYFIDLTEIGEMPNYRRLLSKWAEYVRYPIADTALPKEAAQMREIQARIREAMEKGHGVFVHCRAGIGRTGMAMGCFLVEDGMAGRAALEELNRLWKQSARASAWPRIPQTREQADYITRWEKQRRASAP